MAQGKDERYSRPKGADMVDPNDGREDEIIHVPVDTINRFICPVRLAVIGSSESGKSHLILQLIEKRQLLFTTEFREIYFCMPRNYLLYCIIFIS